MDYRKGDDVMAKDRKVSRRGGILPELGVNRTSSGSFPANVPGLVTLTHPLVVVIILLIVTKMELVDTTAKL